MRPVFYLFLIGFMAFLLWSGESQESARTPSTITSEEPSRTPLRSHGTAVTGILVHDGVVYTGDEGGTIRASNPDSASKGQEWVAHLGPIRQLFWIGERLVSVSADGTVAWWLLDGTPERRERFSGHHLNGAVVADSGAVIVAADRGSIARIDVGHQWRMAGIHARAAFSVALAPDQKRVVSGGADGQLRQWEVSTGKEGLAWRGHEGWVTKVDWDGEAIWSAGSDGRVKKWRLGGDVLLNLEGSQKALTALRVGEGIVAVGSESGDIRIFEEGTGVERWRQSIGESVMSLSVGPRGVYVGHESGKVTIWDMTNGRLMATLRGD